MVIDFKNRHDIRILPVYYAIMRDKRLHCVTMAFEKQIHRNKT